MPAYYDDWREQQFSCSKCGWQGLGSQLAQGETFDDLFEVDCPTCHARLSVVTFPTLQESRANWDKVSPADRLVVQHVEQAIAEQAIMPPEPLKLIRSTDLKRSPAPALAAAQTQPAATAEIPALRTALNCVAVALALGALPLGYAYYSLLRLVAFVAFASIAYLAYRSRHWPALIVAMLLLFLFNPLLPVHLNKIWWATVDVGSAAYVAVVSRYAATRFAGLGAVPLKASGVFMSFVAAAFAGVLAATTLAFLFFLASFPLEWLGRPSPFKTLPFLFLAVFAGGVVFTLTGLAYHHSFESGTRAVNRVGNGV